MKRKEYAVSLGLATSGKGRMSLEATAACDKAEAEGTRFSDSKGKAGTASAAPVMGAKNDPEAAAIEGFPVMFMPRFPNDWKTAEGKLVGNRAVCVHCSNSLLFNACANPEALNRDGEIVPVFHGI